MYLLRKKQFKFVFFYYIVLKRGLYINYQKCLSLQIQYLCYCEFDNFYNIEAVGIEFEIILIINLCTVGLYPALTKHIVNSTLIIGIRLLGYVKASFELN